MTWRSDKVGRHPGQHTEFATVLAIGVSTSCSLSKSQAGCTPESMSITELVQMCDLHLTAFWLGQVLGTLTEILPALSLALHSTSAA